MKIRQLWRAGVVRLFFKLKGNVLLTQRLQFLTGRKAFLKLLSESVFSTKGNVSSILIPLIFFPHEREGYSFIGIGFDSFHFAEKIL